ncbi:MAG: acetylornithine/succinylornithine family transaminase [Candidatus Tyrphobacter sp.]
MSARGPLMNTYNRAPITIVSGHGCTLVDSEGRQYLDFIAGIAVCALGHAHPAIAQAVEDQARRLVHASNLYAQEPSGTLAHELVRRSGMSAAFFCNSGSEANEAAIKLARKWAFRRNEPRRTTILACTGSFHGRTLGALAATDNARYREGFAPLPAGFAFVRFNDAADVHRKVDDRVAAVLVEPVQGESGVHPAEAEFLRAARAACNERGALLIFDEIQCGMGRIGPLFAFQRFGVRPDVLTMAKALANGLPIGVMLAGDRAAGAFEPGDHGSTFGGSPVPAAAALAHLRVRDELDLETRVLERSSLLFEKLRDLAARHAGVLGAPRGIGLLAGIPVNDPSDAKAIQTAARERGLLLGTAGGNTLRIAPPLIVSEEEVARGVALLDEAISATFG